MKMPDLAKQVRDAIPEAWTPYDGAWEDWPDKRILFIEGNFRVTANNSEEALERLAKKLDRGSKPRKFVYKGYKSIAPAKWWLLPKRVPYVDE